MDATIAELGPLIKRRRLSPVELAKASLERSERLDPTLHAFTTLAPEYALKRAQQAEKEIIAGQYRGPSHGIPYTLKDVIATKEVRTTFGHPRLIDFKPQEDATVHTLLEEAGAVLLGKVYSHIGRGDTPVMCFSPWDPQTSPGTSSSGSASAVAAGIGLFSIGSDTGGSVRHPASNCGLIGMKATFGRISRFGVWASSWTSDQAGPLCKTSEDCAILMEVLACYDPKDLVSLNLPRSRYRLSLRRGINGLRIGVPRDNWVWKEWINEDEETAVRKAIGVLEELGAEIVEVSMPLAEGARSNSLAAEASVWLEDNFSKEILEGWWELHPQIERGRKQTVDDYVHGLHKRAAIRQEIVDILTKVDLVAMPTGNTIADRWDATTASIRGRTVPARSRAAYLNGLASQAGVPALSIPCGFAKGGKFPVGLQLVGRDVDERIILRVAHAYQEATKWHKKRPSI